MPPTLFLFELEFPTVNYVYSLFFAIGGIGFLLGLWRWWLSLIWLIIPNLLIGSAFLLGQTMEIYSDLHEAIIRTYGENYIWHNYISVISGFLLNILGVFVKSFYSKKINLR